MEYNLAMLNELLKIYLFIYLYKLISDYGINKIILNNQMIIPDKPKEKKNHNIEINYK